MPPGPQPINLGIMCYFLNEDYADFDRFALQFRELKDELFIGL